MNEQNILVWDLPTRVFHWLLALSFVGAYATADSERTRDVHVLLGYTMLGLVVFRLVWGVAGTRYARFASFAFGPRRVWAYLESLAARAPQHYVGHNPAGSWGIYALLALTVAAGATGYAAYDDIGYVWIGDAHETTSNILLSVVLIHLAGVFVSSIIHRENLVRAMVSGCKSGRREDGIRHNHRIVAAILLLAVVVYWMA